MKDQRRTLDEQLGIDMHASALRVESRQISGETPLVRLAALGAAVMHVRAGADRHGRGGPIAAGGYGARPIDTICGDLAALMYHIRAGGQLELVPKAIALFASYVGMRPRIRDHEQLRDRNARERSAFLHRFAAVVLNEVLSDRCVPCGGSGKLERARSGSWIRPTGRVSASYRSGVVFMECPHCHGSRKALPSQTARRKALELTFEQYQAGRWQTHFRAAQIWLEQAIYRRLRRPLQVQLERGTKRT